MNLIQKAAYRISSLVATRGGAPGALHLHPRIGHHWDQPIMVNASAAEIYCQVTPERPRENDLKRPTTPWHDPCTPLPSNSSP